MISFSFQRHGLHCGREDGWAVRILAVGPARHPRDGDCGGGAHPPPATGPAQGRERGPPASQGPDIRGKHRLRACTGTFGYVAVLLSLNSAAILKTCVSAPLQLMELAAFLPNTRGAAIDLSPSKAQTYGEHRYLRIRIHRCSFGLWIWPPSWKRMFPFPLCSTPADGIGSVFPE